MDGVSSIFNMCWHKLEQVRHVGRALIRHVKLIKMCMNFIDVELLGSGFTGF